MTEKAAAFLDPRAWKLADVLILLTLAFNLGVEWQGRKALAESQAAQAMAIKQGAEERAILRGGQQGLEVRVAILETRMGPARTTYSPVAGGFPLRQQDFRTGSGVSLAVDPGPHPPAYGRGGHAVQFAVAKQAPRPAPALAE
jgi:hypothetical protein